MHIVGWETVQAIENTRRYIVLEVLRSMRKDFVCVCVSIAAAAATATVAYVDRYLSTEQSSKDT